MKTKLKYLLAVLVIISGCSSTGNHKPYAKAGAGYKFTESHIYWENSDGTFNEGSHPISARFELGFEYNNWSYGVSHHSQYATGRPFNNKDGEYQKTEIFIDYKFYF